MPRKGQQLSAAARAKVGAAKRGIPLSAEHRRKLREARKGRVFSPEDCAKISAGRKGKGQEQLSPEHRAEIGRSLRRSAKFRAYHDGRLRVVRGRLPKEARAAAQSRRVIERMAMLSAEERRQQTAAGRLANARRVAQLSPQERKALTEPAGRAARRANPSRLERTVAEILEALGIHALPQYEIGAFTVDFYVPSRQLVIECDGEYWHRGRLDHDSRRDAILGRLGYRVLRLPERQIVAGEAMALLAPLVVGGTQF